jgi:hypothetical protein
MCRYFLPACDLSSDSLNIVFYRTEVLNCNELCLINYFFHVLSTLVTFPWSWKFVFSIYYVILGTDFYMVWYWGLILFSICILSYPSTVYSKPYPSPLISSAGINQIVMYEGDSVSCLSILFIKVSFLCHSDTITVILYLKAQSVIKHILNVFFCSAGFSWTYMC